MVAPAQVKASRRFTDHKEGNRLVHLSPEHDAVVNGTTIFLKRRVASSVPPRLLKSGMHSRKIGSHVTKGWMKGRPIYTLTLEERATCPRSCHHWGDCFGSKMHWPQRIQADDGLMPRLAEEIAALCRKHKQGILVRLHVLGDFFSATYAQFWGGLLVNNPGLSIFGYTAWQPGTEIGAAVGSVQRQFGRRFMVRYSDGPVDVMRTVSVGSEAEGVKAGAIVCPAQTGRSPSCGDCCLCFHTERPIGFIGH